MLNLDLGVGFLLGVGILGVMLVVRKLLDKRKAARAVRFAKEHLRPEWHSKYSCIPGYVSPQGIVDVSRPLAGVWMCGGGDIASMKRCKGFGSLREYGKKGEVCMQRGEFGECLLVGRVTSLAELNGEE